MRNLQISAPGGYVRNFSRRLLLLSVMLSVGILFAQSQKPQMPKASVGGLFARALTAISGGTPVHDVVQTGKVRRIAGSTDETGEAELKAMVSGEVRIDLSFPSGPSSEVYARGQRGPVGEWSGADRMLHAMASHNLLVDAAWFCPVLVLERAAAQSKIVTVAGTKNSGVHPLDHLQVASPPPAVDYLERFWMRCKRRLNLICIWIQPRLCRWRWISRRTRTTMQARIFLFAFGTPTTGPSMVYRFLFVCGSTSTTPSISTCSSMLPVSIPV
jgi:hypothetical protein